VSASLEVLVIVTESCMHTVSGTSNEICEKTLPGSIRKKNRQYHINSIFPDFISISLVSIDRRIIG
jgi:hypothetical protein